jgi:hypothetical protein
MKSGPGAETDPGTINDGVPITSNDTNNTKKKDDGSDGVGDKEEVVEEEEEDDDAIYTELIYDEMMLCCKRLSVQEMHTELEQKLQVSPFHLLKSCLAIARVDGIITTTTTTTQTNTEDDSNPEIERHRLFPSELWKSMKVQDIVVHAYLNTSDHRKSILLPSYWQEDNEDSSSINNNSNDHDNGTKHLLDEKVNESNNENDEAIEAPPLSRMECIQKELAGLEKSSMKLLFNELENVWGISPRCIYVCTIAVLRVLNVVDKERMMDEDISKHHESQERVNHDPQIRNMVERAMSNPQLDAILSQAIMKPHIRNLVLAYIENPRAVPSNVQDDPEIQKIFTNPVFQKHMEQIMATSSPTTTSK